MIKRIKQNDIPECVKVIRESFATVNGEHRPMYGYFEDGKLVGY